MSDKPDVYVEVDVGNASNPDIFVEVFLGDGGANLPENGTPGQVLTKTEDGAEWQDPTPGGVTSVNGATGDVKITPEDIGALPKETLPEAVNAALAQAKESGEFNGEDGYTPVKGKDYFDGKDAISPIVAVSDIAGGHRITITDANGVKVVDVLDGSKGDAGRGIASITQTAGNGAAGTTDIYTITYTDGTKTTFEVYNGKNGSDGYSPSARVDQTSEGVVITVTDKTGTTSAVVKGTKEPLTGTTSEITPQQVAQAIFDGRDVTVSHEYNFYGTVIFSDFAIGVDVGMVAASVAFDFDGKIGNAQLVGYIESGEWVADAIGLAKAEDIPDTSAFITRTVSDLENYYLKSQTYTRSEIDQKLSTIPKFSISVMSALPTDYSETTIYLIPGGADSNLYTEYINVNGTWEILGSQRVDLTGYATQTWTLEQLVGYQPKGDYALKSELPTVPTNVSAFQNDAGYAKKTELPTALSQLSEDATHRVVTDAEKDAWNAKSNFSGEYADLEGKPTIPTVPTNVSAFENDAGYLTEHQDISGKLDANKLPEAIDDALAQAKASGEFDGADGYTPQRGTDYWTPADKQEIVQEATENFPILAETPEESVHVLDSGDIPGIVQQAIDSIDLADYVKIEAEAVARIVNQHQSGDSIVFPFLADAHCGYYTDPSNDAVKLAGQLLHQIGKRVPYDFIANGGDFSTGAWNTTRANAYEEIEDYTELTSDAHKGVPAVWVPGNHDDAPYKATVDRVSQTEMFALIGRKSRVSGAVCPNGCNYGYLDLENRKLRVIYLDTHDRRSWGSVEVGSGQESTYLNVENIGGVQLQWLAEQALDFAEKTNPEEWAIVVVSHAALTADGTWTDPVSGTSYAVNTANAAAILSAYGAGKSGSITHNGMTVSYDFSVLENRAIVICCVHGHDHKFTSATVSGILSIGCPNVMNGRERVSEDGNTYTKTAGTADGTSFCILTIDRENQLIYADCVGAGYDREFEYTTEVVSYTNQLPISTDANGNVYNGKGWKENTYISSGNDSEDSGYYASGFIPCAGNDRMYFSNVEILKDQDRHRFAFYNANKEFLSITKTNNANFGGFSWNADNTLTSIIIPNGNPTGVKFVRFCCSYIGEDSVVTVNEPIE